MSSCLLSLVLTFVVLKVALLVDHAIDRFFGLVDDLASRALR